MLLFYFWQIGPESQSYNPARDRQRRTRIGTSCRWQLARGSSFLNLVPSPCMSMMDNRVSFPPWRMKALSVQAISPRRSSPLPRMRKNLPTWWYVGPTGSNHSRAWKPKEQAGVGPNWHSVVFFCWCVPNKKAYYNAIKNTRIGLSWLEFWGVLICGNLYKSNYHLVLLSTWVIWGIQNSNNVVR